MKSPSYFAQSRPIIPTDYWPWMVFGSGILSVPVVFAIGCLSSHPPPNWDSSFFGRRLAWPLMIFAFCCCVASPFFTRLPGCARFVLALTGALIVGFEWLISMMVLWFLYPPLV